MKTIRFKHYEVNEATGAYAIGHCYQSVAEALNEINYSYKRALENGYDNRDRKYVIIECATSRISTDEGIFISEKITRDAVHFVRFDENLGHFIATIENLI